MFAWKENNFPVTKEEQLEETKTLTELGRMSDEICERGRGGLSGQLLTMCVGKIARARTINSIANRDPQGSRCTIPSGSKECCRLLNTLFFSTSAALLPSWLAY